MRVSQCTDMGRADTEWSRGMVPQGGHDMVKGLHFENSGGGAGVTIRIAHDETENAPLVRTVFLTQEEWAAVVAEVGVQLAPEAFADAVEALPSAEDATLTEVPEETPEESAAGEQAADEADARTEAREDAAEDASRRGKRRR